MRFTRLFANRFNISPENAQTIRLSMIERQLFDECAKLVRKHDYDGYLATLLLPTQHTRHAVMAARAFNVELSMLRDKIERHSGHAEIMRLDFWKDSIDALFCNKKNTLPRQPTIRALAACIRDTSATFQSCVHKQFLTLVQARRDTIGDRPFKVIEAFEEYGRQTHGQILAFSLACIHHDLHLPENLYANKACNLLGSALGIVTQCRAVLPLIARRQPIVLLPTDLLKKFQIKSDDFLRNAYQEKLRILGKHFADRADNLVAQCRRESINLAKDERKVLAQCSTVDAYTRRSAELKHNLLDPKLQYPFGTLAFKMFYQVKLKGGY